MNKEKLLENTLYTTDEEYNNIVLDRERVAKLFMTTFLGFLAMYGSDEPRPILTSYFKNEGRVSLRNIQNDNNDLSIVIRLAHDAGIIRRRNALKMIEMVFLLKKDALKKLNEMELRELIADNPELLRNLTGKYREEYNKYIKEAQSIYQMIFRLRFIIRMDNDLSIEFQDILKKYSRELRYASGISTEEIYLINNDPE